jgi:hypothetical protein
MVPYVFLKLGHTWGVLLPSGYASTAGVVDRNVTFRCLGISRGRAHQSAQRFEKPQALLVLKTELLP